MAVNFVRTLIIIITLMVLMRLMGKREIGEMQPYEFVITLIIADLACIPMADVSIPLTYGIVAIVCVFLLHQILTILEQSGSIVRRIISWSISVSTHNSSYPWGIKLKLGSVKRLIYCCILFLYSEFCTM